MTVEEALRRYIEARNADTGVRATALARQAAALRLAEALVRERTTAPG